MGTLLLLLLLESPTGSAVVPGKELKRAIQHYRDALAKVRWNLDETNISALYAQARLFGVDRTPELAAETATYLEACSGEQKAALVEQLPGLRLAGPKDPPQADLRYFATLTKGEKLDEGRTFFESLQRLYLNDGKRAWEERGCVDLASLTRSYKHLRSTGSKTPHYRPSLAKEELLLLGAFQAGCVCKSQEDARRELKDLVKSSSKDPLLPKIREILDGIPSRGAAFSCATPPSPAPSPP